MLCQWYPIDLSAADGCSSSVGLSRFSCNFEPVETSSDWFFVKNGLRRSRVSKERIAIILPNRIGDALLSLPAILCLKQLINAHAPDHYAVTLYTHVPVVDIVTAANLFDIKSVNLSAKINSWLHPADKAFFLTTTSKHFGFHAKKTYGLMLQNKKFIRYSVDMPCLNFSPESSGLPADLVTFLQERHGLPFYAVRLFGICLELGFTVDQICSSFKYSGKSLLLADEFFDWRPPVDAPYLVVCMEAAYGGVRHNSDRRWQEGCYFDIAERVYRQHGCRSIFIGINTQPSLPVSDYCIDLRGKLNLKQLAQTLHASRGYVGNDTGPLHVANLVRRPSLGIYFRDDYHAPLFGDYNTVVMRPQSPQEVYPLIDRLLGS